MVTAAMAAAVAGSAVQQASSAVAMRQLAAVALSLLTNVVAPHAVGKTPPAMVTVVVRLGAILIAVRTAAAVSAIAVQGAPLNFAAREVANAAVMVVVVAIQVLRFVAGPDAVR